ncbi:DUF1289 domain-containing protein [Vibrio galatheae]
MSIRYGVRNPCIGLCEMKNDGISAGCGRSRQERYLWYRLPESKQERS